MDLVHEVTQLILMLLQVSQHTHHVACKHTAIATRLAPVIVEVFQEDATLAARIMARESTFRWSVTSAKGSAGYMGINPNGVATIVCKGLRYTTQVRAHFRCGRNIMNYYRKLCGTDDPLRWLSPYNGLRYCRPSDYSRRVLSDKP